jgi:hypothetical protein
MSNLINEIKRNRELMALTPLNEQWSGNQVFHEFEDCAGSGTGNNQVGSPYTSSMTTNVGGGVNVWDTYENSEAAWDFLGAMAPGQVMRNLVVTGNTPQHCIKYLGPVTSGQFQTILGSGVGNFGLLSGTTGPYASCNSCLAVVTTIITGNTTTPSFDCDGQGTSPQGIDVMTVILHVHKT